MKVWVDSVGRPDLVQCDARDLVRRWRRSEQFKASDLVKLILVVEALVEMGFNRVAIPDMDFEAIDQGERARARKYRPGKDGVY